MLKRDVINQLKSLMENSEDSRTEEGDIWDKDVEALRIAIKAVESFEFEERGKIAVLLDAKRSPENGNTFYCDLETGERLVINTDYKFDLEEEFCTLPVGKLEGIYNPGKEKELEKHKKFLNRLVGEIQCFNCPARYTCTEKDKTVIPRKACEEHLFETLTF
jgi:hypothetical protein